MPESIGSKKRVLPPGIVCDGCNNYFARKVEGPVLTHHSMRNLRAWHQVPNKRGKLPTLQGHIGGSDIPVTLRLGPDGKIQLAPERERDRDSVQAEISGGFQNAVLFKIEMDPPARDMSRFLCKMALEAIAEASISNGDDAGFIRDTEFFDNARIYARYGSNFKEWPYSVRRIYPEDTFMRHPDTQEWVQAGFGCCWFMNGRRETLFAFCFYGHEFVINVGGPSIKGYEEWLEVHGQISPMIERLGCQLVAVEKDGSKSHYLQGTLSVLKGMEFDRAHGYCP